MYNLMQKLFNNAYFPKTNLLTRVHKNGHNSACDQCFFLELASLYVAHIELSIHTKNSLKSQMVPFLIAGHICTDTYTQTKSSGEN